MERHVDSETYRKEGLEHLASFEEEDKGKHAMVAIPGFKVVPSVLKYGERFFYSYAWEWYFRDVENPGSYTKFGSHWDDSYMNRGIEPPEKSLDAAVTNPGVSVEIGINYRLSPEQLVMLVSRLWFGTNHFKLHIGEIFENDLQKEVWKLVRRQTYLWNKEGEKFHKKLDEIWPKAHEALDFLYEQEDLPALACSLSDRPKNQKNKAKQRERN